MFFTHEDYRKIEEYLKRKSIKDTQFNEAITPLDGTEEVAFVQKGKNVKAHVKDIVDQLFLLGVSDFLNITDKYHQSYIDLKEAIDLIPFLARKEGQVITFINKSGDWVIYQFKGTRKNQWNNITLWENVISTLLDSKLEADEEDITTKKRGDKYQLKFKDKEYNKEEFSGLGKIILRKNVSKVMDPTEGKPMFKNLLTQPMFKSEDTAYVIRYDYSLNGGAISLPKNSTLEFDGGSIIDGKIEGRNTRIINSTSNSFINIETTGTWNTELSEPIEGEIKTVNVVRDIIANQDSINNIENNIDNIEEDIKDIDKDLSGLHEDFNKLPKVDEEDITVGEDNFIRFKDKEYSEKGYSGLGRVYLRKNIVDGKNILTQEMVNKSNTRYIIQYDYDLNEKEIIIPQNSVLNFYGGSFSDGTLIGNNTCIKHNNTVFYNVKFKGTFSNDKIKSSLFDFKYNDKSKDNYNQEVMLSMLQLVACNINKYIYLSGEELWLPPLRTKEGWQDTHPRVSNIELKNGYVLELAPFLSIKLTPSDRTHYNIIGIHNSSDVIIIGNGSFIYGDVDTHKGTTGEWGMGIYIYDSQNITISNINIYKCWGDGIMVSGNVPTTSEEHYKFSSNILIQNSNFIKNRRQGISLCSAVGVSIINCKFIETKGTAPSAGIDIEPNIYEIVKDVLIENCIFKNNEGQQLAIIALTKESRVENVKVNKCFFYTDKKSISSHIIQIANIRKEDSSYIKNVLITSCNIVSDIDDHNYLVAITNTSKDITLSYNDIFSKKESASGIYLNTSENINILNNNINVLDTAIGGININTLVNVSNNTITNANIAISSGSSSLWTINRNTIINSRYRAITLWGQSDSNISHNKIVGASNALIFLGESTRNIDVTNNRLIAKEELVSIIRTENKSTNNTFSDNICDGKNVTKYFFDGSGANNYIHSNKVENVDTFIETSMSNSTIQMNTIYNIRNIGNFYETQNNTFSSNIITNFLESLHLSACIKTVISNNFFIINNDEFTVKETIFDLTGYNLESGGVKSSKYNAIVDNYYVGIKTEANAIKFQYSSHNNYYFNNKKIDSSFGEEINAYSSDAVSIKSDTNDGYIASKDGYGVVKSSDKIEVIDENDIETLKVKINEIITKLKDSGLISKW